MAKTTYVSRRSLFAAASATMAGTAVAAGTPLGLDAFDAPDPIFALIEKHRAAHAAFDAACGVRDAVEMKLPNVPSPRDEPSWSNYLREHPDLEAAEDAWEAGCDAEEAAFADLLRAVPSATPAGFLALARYACDLTCEDEGEAVEGASQAYRVLAALAGRPVFGDFDNEEA